jgi:hypothetical protein
MKYVDGFRRRITVRIAAYRRKEFSKLIKQLPDWKKIYNINSEEKGDFDLVSFSSSRDLEEQVLSILSLLKWYGYPKNWYVYSDGTHTESDIKILESLGSFVKVVKWDKNIEKIKPSDKDTLLAYSNTMPMGKRLICFTTHEIKNRSIYLDSDIVFYKGILQNLEAVTLSSYNWFLPDIGWGTLDSRYIKQQKHPQMYQLNGGFNILNKEFSWDKALEFVSKLENKFEYFSDQTAFHINIINQNSYPLDPRKFVMHAKDQFLFTTLQQSSEIAIRHFISPVRHKMWQNGHEWHLK